MKWKMLTLAVLTASLVGCNEGPKTAPPASAAMKKDGTKHESWWCDEHGVPEADCSLCSAKVAKASKAAGDWCDKHDRAKSQCFLCEPKLKEKYAGQYRTKYGKEPPATTED